MGDALNGIYVIETEAVRGLYILHPSQRYLDTNRLGVGTNITLPDQTFIAWNSYLGTVDPEVEAAIRATN